MAPPAVAARLRCCIRLNELLVTNSVRLDHDLQRTGDALEASGNFLDAFIGAVD